VSNRGGYDYAMATDAKGNELATMRPYVYPPVIFTIIAPEINPGSRTWAA